MQQDREVSDSISTDATRRYQFLKPLQVCAAHGVIAREVGRATSCDLGTENSRGRETGVKGATRTRGLQFCCINLYALTTPPSAQIAERHAHNDLRNTPSRPPPVRPGVARPPRPTCPHRFARFGLKGQRAFAACPSPIRPARRSRPAEAGPQQPARRSRPAEAGPRKPARRSRPGVWDAPGLAGALGARGAGR